MASLADLGRVDVDAGRRRVLAGGVAYSVAALALPTGAWWVEMAGRDSARTAAGARRIGRGDVDAVRDMVSVFSRIDQRRGGGHARTAIVQYLTSDVARYLRGRFSDDQVHQITFV